VEETDAELVIAIETIADLVGCPDCGVVAVAHDRMSVEYRDLVAFGRPARLAWAKRRWRCREPACPARTRTETSPAFSSRCLLTNRAGRECWVQCASFSTTRRTSSETATDGRRGSLRRISRNVSVVPQRTKAQELETSVDAGTRTNAPR
jgi:hypothetical protein